MSPVFAIMLNPDLIGKVVISTSISTGLSVAITITGWGALLAVIGGLIIIGGVAYYECIRNGQTVLVGKKD